MRRDDPRILLLALAMNVVITAIVVLVATGRTWAAVVLVSIVATLTAAYLVRRWARQRLVYASLDDRHQSERAPSDDGVAGDDSEPQIRTFRSREPR